MSVGHGLRPQHHFDRSGCLADPGCCPRYLEGFYTFKDGPVVQVGTPQPVTEIVLQSQALKRGAQAPRGRAVVTGAYYGTSEGEGQMKHAALGA